MQATCPQFPDPPVAAVREARLMLSEDMRLAMTPAPLLGLPTHIHSEFADDALVVAVFSLFGVSTAKDLLCYGCDGEFTRIDVALDFYGVFFEFFVLFQYHASEAVSVTEFTESVQVE